MTLYFQGDVCIERVEDAAVSGSLIPRSADGAIVLAEGEATGHRHALWEPQLTFFRDDALARDLPRELYIGHLSVEEDYAALRHDEHDTIFLPKGTYRIRRQREYEGSDLTSDPAFSRLVLVRD